MQRHEHVPVKTIAASIGMVLATGLVLLLIWALRPILVWMLIAAFFAVSPGDPGRTLGRRPTLAPAATRSASWSTGFASMISSPAIRKRIRQALSNIGAPALHVVGAAAHAIAGVVTIFVLSSVENYFLQPVILSRTVQLNPLTVLVAILFGVQLAGILGALLAIPVAGVIQVIVRDLWDTRRGQQRATDDGPERGTGRSAGNVRRFAAS